MTDQHAVDPDLLAHEPSFIQGALWMAAVALLLAAIYVSGVKPIGISADLRNYEWLYDSSAISDWRSIFTAGDFGYFGLAKLAATFGLSFHGFAFVIAACTCVLLFVTATAIDTNKIVLVAVYFSYLFWLHEYTQIRISAALGIGLYAIYAARPTIRWPLLLLAVTLHNSFILLVGGYALVKVRRIGVLAAVGAVGVFLLVGPLSFFFQSLVQRIINYQDLASTTGQFSSINIFSLLPLVQLVGMGIAALHFKELTEQEKEELALSAMGFVAYYALAFVPVLAFRTFELFMPFFVILVSRLTRRSQLIWAVVAMLILLGVRSSFLAADSVVIL